LGPELRSSSFIEFEKPATASLEPISEDCVCCNLCSERTLGTQVNPLDRQNSRARYKLLANFMVETSFGYQANKGEKQRYELVVFSIFVPLAARREPVC
jgi:DNA topoisomerase VI subunit B